MRPRNPVGFRSTLALLLVYFACAAALLWLPL